VKCNLLTWEAEWWSLSTRHVTNSKPFTTWWRRWWYVDNDKLIRACYVCRPLHAIQSVLWRALSPPYDARPGNLGSERQRLCGRLRGSARPGTPCDVTLPRRPLIPARRRDEPIANSDRRLPYWLCRLPARPRDVTVTSCCFLARPQQSLAVSPIACYDDWKLHEQVTRGAANPPHCRVLPPGEFNDTISEPLTVYSESFITIVVIVFP